MSDKREPTKEEAVAVYERCMKKFEAFNTQLAKEEGYFIGVTNRPIFDVFPVTEDVKKILDENEEED